MSKSFTFPPGSKIEISDFPTRVETGDYDKSSAAEKIQANAEVMADHARRLYAENRRSILLLLQGMDTAGKDGTIRTVMRGMNPRSCQVHSFKQPSEEERDHDFLWRVHKVAPRKGNIGIFNRSHYEDVLVVRVHNFVPPQTWQQRYQQINDFEKLLNQTGTTLIKCYLHISRDEQRERLQRRIDEPRSNWKFNQADLEERRYWDDYQRAYQDALIACNTEHAPWHIIPSDRKWYRNLLVSELMRKALEKLNPQYPTVTEDLSQIVVE
ncbi:MAG: polyphosphate kinase 2 family protein [Mariniblastus sp.]|nr:polyphosphate kinase 2 family protein [Mariniblastus sp.]